MLTKPISPTAPTPTAPLAHDPGAVVLTTASGAVFVSRCNAGTFANAFTDAYLSSHRRQGKATTKMPTSSRVNLHTVDTV